jgi:hypothetical protein
MPRKISIGWFRQKSGRYALKGVTIVENDRAYDSTSTFRDEDARWLTDVLGAEADVELASNTAGERAPEGYPEWARSTGFEPNGEVISPLVWERASATVLRHFLGQMIATYQTENGRSGFQKLRNEANAALLATDAGTYYTLEQACAILGRRSPKTAITITSTSKK